MQDSNNMYLRIVETAQVGIWITDSNNITSYVNDKTAEMLGYSKQELIGKPFTDYLADKSTKLTIINQTSKHSAPRQADTEFCCKDGSRIWTITSYSYFHNENGEFDGKLMIVIDITTRKQTEKLSKESEDGYRQLFSLIAEAIFLTDNKTGQIIEANEAASELYGFSKEELLAMKNTDISSEPDKTRQATKESMTCIPLRWHRKKDGTIFPVEITSKRLAWYEQNVHITTIRNITQRYDAEKALIESNQRYRDIFEYASDCIFLVDVIENHKFKYLMFNPAEEKSIGFKSEEVSGKFVEEIFDRELANILINNYSLCCKKGTTISYEEVLKLPTGLAYFNTSLIPIKNSKDQVVRIVGIASDITTQKRMEESIRHRIDLEAAIAQASRLLVSPGKANLTKVLKILGKAVAVNRSYIFRMRDNGNKMDNVAEWCSVGTEPQIENLQNLDSNIFPWWMKKLENQENINIPNVDILPSYAAAEKEILQAQKIKSLIVVPINSTDGKLNGFMGFDDTEKIRKWSDEDIKALRVAAEMVGMYWKRKQIEKALQYQASHDALTNIPNRYQLEKILKIIIKKAKTGKNGALLFIDLDNFKLINDTFGHETGDKLLIALVDVFFENLPKNAFLSRLGGDEFAVLLEDTPFQEAETVAEKLRRAVWESKLNLITHGFRLNLSISVGIAIIDGTLCYQRCLALADTALYKAKERGRNRVAFAEPKDDPVNRLTETNRILDVIKNALQEDGFVLHFQPVFKIKDKKILHYESLIRIKDQNGQIIHPYEFIPVAESFGLMSQIDLWVVKSSLNVLCAFPKSKLFVNLSGVTLSDDTALKRIESYIRESGIAPSRMGFEITETAAVQDLIRAENWIHKLKKLGCLFALDDFGKGFSSFSYLQTLPVDYIKLDGSFVENADKEPVHRALIQAIYTIANTLGMKTIAEFVANEAVFNVLKTIGVDYGQGFFLGRPKEGIKM